MAPPPEEVDLTSDTPPRKMKQARLPFAPLNKSSAASNKKVDAEIGRKRKLSSSTDVEEENLTPNKKAAKTETAPAAKENVIKSKLAMFAHKEDAEVRVSEDIEMEEKPVEEIKSKNEKEKKNIKPKKDKASSKDKTVDNDDKIGKDSSKFQGLLKMPFKKSSKKQKDKDQANVEDEDSVDLVLVLESSTEESALMDKSGNLNLTEGEDASITSMTEEWAKFHENNESMEEMEAGKKGAAAKKTKEEKQKEKEEKARKKQEEKAMKEEEKAKAKAEKEKTKQQAKDKAKSKDKEEKGKIEESGVTGVKDNKPPALKVNPLAKFLSKVKDVEHKNAPAKDENKVSPAIVSMDGDNNDNEGAAGSTTPKVPNATSTPLRTSPRKKVVPEDPVEVATTPVTPLRTSPRKKISSVAGTPSSVSTPDPERAQKLNIAKLKVKVTELNISMEKAVEDKEFLKAHEAKEQIKKLQADIESMEADTSYVSQSLETLESEKKEEHVAKTPKTPKSRNISVVSTPGSAAKLTPGSKLSKKEKLEQERQAKKEALEKEKQAKKEALEKEKQAKKEAKEKEKAEKDRLKELERKAKEEEKLEKEKARKEEKEKAEEERLKLKQEKEDERLRKKAEKEAEAKQREEEKKQIEEAEKEKAKKKAEAFTSFFKKAEPKEEKVNKTESKVDDEPVGCFTPFRVKKNTRLAPLVRGDPEAARARIDSLDMPSGPDGLYLQLLKKGYVIGRQGKTWPYEKVEGEEDEVEILDEDDVEESDPEDDLDETNANIVIRKGGDKSVKIPRAKLLKFHENRRPAYWGTWTKTSKMICGRRPFARDEERFEYEYDSDDDWEEEEEGESLSDDEKDKDEDEEKEDYEVDNEFFVPHGYLSDEEEDREDDEVVDKETVKEKQKLAAKEFEKEHKKKTQELKPRLWGTYWTTEAESLDTEAAALQLAKILGGFTGIVCGDGQNNNPIDTIFTKSVHSPTVNPEEVTDSVKAAGVKGVKAKNVPEEAVPDLIRLVNGNINNKVFLAKEFIAFWNKKTGFEEEAEDGATPSSKAVGSISKTKMIAKILEIAEYKKPPEGSGRRWCVKEDVLNKYGVPTGGASDWTYILEQPNKGGNTETQENNGSRPESPACKAGTSPAPANLITKFARVLTEEEREEQRAKREREAAAAKLRREEQLAAAAAAAPAGPAVPAAAGQEQVKSSPLARFTKQLTDMEKRGQLSSSSSPGGVQKKRVALTPVLTAASKSGPGKTAPSATVTSVKKNPITAIASGQLGSPLTRKAPNGPQASPIAIKRKPGPSSSTKASPIAIKRKPGPVGTATGSASPSFKGMLPDTVTVTPVRSSPRKKPIECVTIED